MAFKKKLPLSSYTPNKQPSLPRPAVPIKGKPSMGGKGNKRGR